MKHDETVHEYIGYTWVYRVYVGINGYTGYTWIYRVYMVCMGIQGIHEYGQSITII